MAEKNKINLKEKFTELLMLPKEIVLDLPKITLIGNEQISIENYKGIIEYDSEKMRINTGGGIIKLFGTNLEINNVTTEEIFIIGNLTNIEFDMS